MRNGIACYATTFVSFVVGLLFLLFFLGLGG
jgi:hypothetical protein